MTKSAKRGGASSGLASSGLNVQDAFNLLERIITTAKAKGADEVEARISQSAGISASIRNGQVEKLNSPNSVGLSIATHIGNKHATASIGTLRPDHIESVIDSVILSTKMASEDPYARPADPSEIISSYAAIDTFDPSEPDVEELKDRARRAEAEALKHPDIKMSNTASASWNRGDSFMLISNGFKGHTTKTFHSVNAMVIAAQGKDMVSSGEYSTAVYGADLISPEDIGAQAALNAANMLGARSIPSQKAPVIFDRDLGPRLLAAFANAVSGPAVARKMTFLKDRMGDQVLNPAITIKDDPFLPRGLGSRAFDSEGMPSAPLTIAEKGVLKSWIMDLASARELGFKSTGHGSGPSNLYIEAGTQSLDEMIADIKQGFYVTELMGGGADVMTSRYSSGAGGFWIENGKIAFAVKELTLGGNLHDMFLSMTPADDLIKRRSALATPSLRINGMTIGGR